MSHDSQQSYNQFSIQVTLEDPTRDVFLWCAGAYTSLDRSLRYIKTIETDIPNLLLLNGSRMMLHDLFYSCRANTHTVHYSDKALDDFLKPAIEIQHHLLDLCCPRVDALFANYDRTELLDVGPEQAKAAKEYADIRSQYKRYKKPTKATFSKLAQWCDNLVVIDQSLHNQASILALNAPEKKPNVIRKYLWQIILLFIAATLTVMGYIIRDPLKETVFKWFNFSTQ